MDWIKYNWKLLLIIVLSIIIGYAYGRCTAPKDEVGDILKENEKAGAVFKEGEKYREKQMNELKIGLERLEEERKKLQEKLQQYETKKDTNELDSRSRDSLIRSILRRDRN